MAGIADVRPGKTWSRRFNHPYTARKNPPRTTLPVFGTNRGAPWELFQAGFGPVTGYRGYNYPGTGVPASWPGPTCAVPPGLPASSTIISIVPDVAQTIAGTLDTALATYFASVPAGAYVSAWHEAEIQGYGTSADVVTAMTRLYGLFNANAPGSAAFGQIISATSATSGSGGYPLTPWMCTPANGGLVLDFYGMDIGVLTTNVNIGTTIGNAISVMTAAGVPQAGPWTIAEVSYNPSWHGTQNQWYSDGWSIAQAIGAIHYMCFFGASGPNVFWPPGNRNILPVLQDIAAVSRGATRSPPASTCARSTKAPFTSSTAATTLTTTFSSNPAAGSKVLVAVQAPSNAVLTVTDNGATPATFFLDACCLSTSGAIPSVYLFRADNITLPGSGTYAVTAAQLSSTVLQVAASAYTGVANGPPTGTSGVSGSGNNPAADPITPADISSLLFSVHFSSSTANPESMSVSSGEFTAQQAQANGSAGSYPGAIADALAGSPATRQGGWMLPDSPNWSMVLAAYGALPVNMQIVPGAEMAWASAPSAAGGVTVNAGLAAASGAGLQAGVAAPAGLASASGWAAINAAGTSANPNAGLAAATGAAAAAAVTVTVAAGLAAGSGAAPFTPGSTVSLTLTALGPVGATGAAVTAAGSDSAAPAASAATGAALNATITASGTATAGLAAATAAASGPAATVSPAPAPAPAAGAAVAPSVTAAVAAGLAAATGTAQQPAVTVTVAAGLAASTGAALNATVTTSGTTNAPAGLAAATGAAAAPAVTISPAPATAPATGTSQAPVATVIPAAGLASGSGAALQAGGQNTGLASASAAALQPTVITGVAPTATTAAATGAAGAPAAQVTVTAGLSASTGASLNPTTTAVFTTGLASATGAAAAPAVTVTVTAGLAASTGASLTVTPTAGMNPAQASATGAALSAAITILVTATTAAGTASGLNATVATGGTANAGLAAATGSGLTAAISAAASSNLAAATGGAQQVPATVSPAATVASASGAAKQAGLGALAGLGAATGTSLTTGVTFSPAALAAISTAAAQQPTVIAAPAVVKGVATTGVTDSNPGTTGVTGSTMAGTVS